MLAVATDSSRKQLTSRAWQPSSRLPPAPALACVLDVYGHLHGHASTRAGGSPPVGERRGQALACGVEAAHGQAGRVGGARGAGPQCVGPAGVPGDGRACGSAAGGQDGGGSERALLLCCSERVAASWQQPRCCQLACERATTAHSQPAVSATTALPQPLGGPPTRHARAQASSALTARGLGGHRHAQRRQVSPCDVGTGLLVFLQRLDGRDQSRVGGVVVVDGIPVGWMGGTQQYRRRCERGRDAPRRMQANPGCPRPAKCLLQPRLIPTNGSRPFQPSQRGPLAQPPTPGGSHWCQPPLGPPVSPEADQCLLVWKPRRSSLGRLACSYSSRVAPLRCSHVDVY